MLVHNAAQLGNICSPTGLHVFLNWNSYITSVGHFYFLFFFALASKL